MTTISRREVLAGAVSTAAALALPTSATAASVTHEVRIKSFTFVPQRISVSVGDKIKWINDDLAPHTATADEFGWDTGELVTGQGAEITVTADMETTYFCVFHPHMKGQLDLFETSDWSELRNLLCQPRANRTRSAGFVARLSKQPQSRFVRNSERALLPAGDIAE